MPRRAPWRTGQLGSRGGVHDDKREVVEVIVEFVNGSLAARQVAEALSLSSSANAYSSSTTILRSAIQQGLITVKMKKGKK